MPGEYTFNSGSKLLTPLGDLLGLSIDKVNFVICVSLSLPFSVWFYHRCSLNKVSRQTRLLLPILFGLCLCFFMYGSAFKHVIFLAVGCYLLIRLCPVNHIHRVVFILSTTYLSWIHWYRATHITYYAIDISGPMMLLVQRATLLAFNIHDGVWKVNRGEKLNDLQKYEAVRQIPSILEYMSYMLNYQGIFCGPLVFYVDYMNWIDEKHVYAKKSAAGVTSNGVHANPIESLPTPWRATMTKLAQALLMIAIFICCGPYLPLSDLNTIDDRGYVSWFVRMYFALAVTRCQYYSAWILADCVHNACGLGFNGYDPVTGEDRWNLISNINVIQCEFGNSWKMLVDNWNISTLHWLRRISYDRVRPDLRVLTTFFLSAWWHGFFPAYYILFLQGALLTIASKRVRSSFRPRCVPVMGQFCYNILTTFVSRMFIVIVCFPWVFIWIDTPLHIYKQLYFVFQVLLVAAIVLVPQILPPPKGQQNKSSQNSGEKVCENSDMNGELKMNGSCKSDSSKSTFHPNCDDQANNNSTDSSSFHSKHE